MRSILPAGLLVGFGTLACGATADAQSPERFIDPRDGQAYGTVEIAELTWMTENLRYAATHSVCYDGEPGNCATLGRLYTWEAALNACPPGWHLSTEFEWQRLELELGVPFEELNSNRERGEPTGELLKPGSDFPLTFPLAGYADPDLNYQRRDETAAIWTANEADYNHAWHRDFDSSRTGIYRSRVHKPWLLSVRCVANRFGGPIEERAAGGSLLLDRYRIVDLSHSYGSDTLYWPTSPSRFEKTPISVGETPGGWYYSAFAIATPEHGGTHLDAPVHFSADGLAADRIPLDQLVGTAVVIDVREQAKKDRNYRLTADRVLAFEAEYGRIQPGAIVLLHTGWSQYWPDAKKYLGDDRAGDASRLRFPAYGENAARLLVDERHVAVLGVDTASTDFGKSTDFIVHRVAAARNVSNLENLTNLAALPATGALVFALPMKIEGGSGAPVRVIALVPAASDHDDH